MAETVRVNFDSNNNGFVDKTAIDPLFSVGSAILAPLTQSIFVGSNGTLLSAYAPEVGASFTYSDVKILTTAASANNTIQSNQANLAIANTGVTQDLAASDCVKHDYWNYATGDNAAIILRYQGDGNMIIVDLDGTNCAIKTVIGDAIATVATAGFIPVNGTTYIIETRALGTSIQVLIDGTEIITGITDQFLAETNFGIGAIAVSQNFENSFSSLVSSSSGSSGGSGFAGFVTVSSSRAIADSDLGKLLVCDTSGGDITLDLDHTGLATPADFLFKAIVLGANNLNFIFTNSTSVTTGNRLDSDEASCEGAYRDGVGWYLLGSELVIAGTFPSAGLINYYRMDEVSGTRIDAIGTDDLTDNNTVTSRPGINNNEAVFVSANNEYLDTAGNYTRGATDFTIAAWVTLDSKAAGQVFIAHFDASASKEGFSLFYSFSADLFRWRTSSNGSAGGRVDLDASTFGSPSASTRYLLVAYFDSTSTGTELGISVNAGTVNTASQTAVFDPALQLFAGAQPDLGTPGLYLDGALDEVGIWNRVLTAMEISDIYNGGTGRFL